MREIFEKYFIESTNKLDWNYINTIPIFSELEKCEQGLPWHGEGNVMNHTLLCLEEASKILPGYKLSLEDERIIIMAILFHDTGKPATATYSNNSWHFHGHEAISERIARRELWDEDLNARERVCTIIQSHMWVLSMSPHSNKFLNSLKYNSDRRWFSWRDLLIMKRCDIRGSIQDPESTTKGVDLREIGRIETEARRLGIYTESFNLPKKVIEGISEVIVLIGIAGSGKSTYIEKNYSGYDVISRDSIRIELGYCKSGEKMRGNADQEKEVSNIFNKRLRELVESGKSVVIDNLSTRKRHRDGYKTILSGLKVCWTYIYLESPSLCSNKSCRSEMKDEVFENMIMDLDMPSPNEYNSFKVIKRS